MSVKNLGKSSLAYAVGNIGLLAASFFLIPLYTHSLSRNDYGQLSTLLTTIQLLLILICMGAQTTVVRFFKEYRDRRQLGVLLGTTASLTAIGSFIVTVAAITVFAPVLRRVLHVDSVFTLTILICCGALARAMSTLLMSSYRADNRPYKYMIAGLSSAVLLIAANFVTLCIFKLGVMGALIAFLASHFLIAVVVGADVASKVVLSFSSSLLRKVLTFGFPLIMARAGRLIMGSASIYFISYYASLEDVAIYNVGYKLAQILIVVLILPFRLSFEPFVFSSANEKNFSLDVARIFTYLLTFIATVSCGILVFSKVLYLDKSVYK